MSKSKNAIIAGLDGFTRQFLATAMWAEMDNSTPNGGSPLESNYSMTDFTVAALKRFIKECKEFQARNAADLEAAFQADSRCNIGQAGHDFWLTRGRHGVGFWEKSDWPAEIGQRLTEAAHAFGEVNLYVQNGKIGAE